MDELNIERFSPSARDIEFIKARECNRREVRENVPLTIKEEECTSAEFTEAVQKLKGTGADGQQFILMSAEWFGFITTTSQKYRHYSRSQQRPKRIKSRPRWRQSKG